MSREYFVKEYKDFIHVYDPIFCSNYYYIKKDYKKTVKKLFNIELQCQADCEGNTTTVETEHGALSFIWIRDKKDVPTLAHECFHAVVHQLNRVGIVFSDDSNELFAYMLEFLMRAIRTKGKSK